MNEIWKPVVGYEGLYEVSNMGNVVSLYKNRHLMSQHLNRPDGYLQCLLSKNKKAKGVKVHKMVVEAFIGEIPKGMVVNHKSECKTDNRLENLEIVTPRENVLYGTAMKRASETKRAKNPNPSEGALKARERYWADVEQQREYFRLKKIEWYKNKKAKTTRNKV